MNPFYKWSGTALMVAGALSLAPLLAGCLGPDIEHDVKTPAVPLPKGGSAASGFLYKERDAQGVVQAAWFNADGHAFYTYLLGKKGSALKPPREAGFGETTAIAPATATYPDGNTVHAGDTIWRLNHEACLDMEQMTGWDLSNEHPPKTLLQKVGL